MLQEGRGEGGGHTAGEGGSGGEGLLDFFKIQKQEFLESVKTFLIQSFVENTEFIVDNDVS